MCVSKMHDECQNCNKRDSCKNKRMVACMTIPNSINITIDNGASVDSDSIAKEIIKRMHKVNRCYFERWLNDKSRCSRTK